MTVLVLIVPPYLQAPDGAYGYEIMAFIGISSVAAFIMTIYCADRAGQ